MNKMKPIESESKYMNYLPSVFHERVKYEEAPFIGIYIKIFEKILSGIDDDKLDGKKGIAEILDIVPELFHPDFSFLFDETKKSFLPPLENEEKDIFRSYFRSEMNIKDFEYEFIDKFLGWMAGWMALVLKEDWELEKKREVVARIIPIYRMRGTKKGIEEFLRIYVGGEVEVFETLGTFQVGESRVGVDTLIGGGMKAHFFKVKVKIPKIDGKEQIRIIRNLKNILDAEKPVHTSYLLKVSVPTLQIGNKDGSKVGKNTLIGGTFTEIHT